MKNKYKIKDDLIFIETKDNVIIIDKKDFDKISQHSWCVSKTGYAVANIKRKTIKMHRYILDLKNPKIVVDHINHNKLDNTRKNLRICSNAQNSRNTSLSKNNSTGVLGVSIRPSGRYRARIMVNGKEIALGTYDTIEEAKRAREEGEKKYFGEFAPIKLKEIENEFI